MDEQREKSCLAAQELGGTWEVVQPRTPHPPVLYPGDWGPAERRGCWARTWMSAPQCYHPAGECGGAGEAPPVCCPGSGGQVEISPCCVVGGQEPGPAPGPWCRSLDLISGPSHHPGLTVFCLPHPRRSPALSSLSVAYLKDRRLSGGAGSPAAPPLVHGPRPQARRAPSSVLCVPSRTTPRCGWGPSVLLSLQSPEPCSSAAPGLRGLCPFLGLSIGWALGPSCFKVALGCVASRALAGGNKTQRG